MLSSLCNINKRKVTKGISSFNSTRKEINENDQSSKNQENDVAIVKIHTPIQSSSVSLTTAICHFLDKGFLFLLILNYSI